MNGKLNSVYENSKKIEFLNSLIKEKTEEAAQLSEKVADYRKKNGKALKNEYDILIYQTNMRISNLNKSISECKGEIRRMKIESGNILRIFYAEATTIEQKAEAETAMRRLYGNKAILTGISENPSENKKVGFVYTDERKNKGKIRKLVKAGIKSDSGKIIANPEVEVYEYVGDDNTVVDLNSPEAMEILERSSGNSTLKIGEDVEKVKRQNLFWERFTACFKDKYKIVTITLFLAFFSAIVFWASAAGYAATFTNGGKTALFASFFIVFATVFSLITLKGAEKGGIWDILPTASFLAGAVALIARIAFKNVGFGLVMPIEFILYGITFFCLRVKLGQGGDEKNGIKDAFSFLAGIVAALWITSLYNEEKILSENVASGGLVWASVVVGLAVVWLTSIGVLEFTKRERRLPIDGVVFLISTIFALAMTGLGQTDLVVKILFFVLFGLDMIAFGLKNLLPRRKERGKTLDK